MLQGRAFKAVFTGGPSNTLLTRRDLDVPLDFDSVRARQSRLGTGAMIVISETGRGVRGDLDALADLCRILPGSGRCGLIDGAVTVVESSLRTFQDKYEAQLLGH
jgi:NADH-quinone oxidoreductase subunit F